jgi:hypothetical protein
MSEEEQRVEAAWNEAADDLKIMVWDWAEHNIPRRRNWILELAKQDISSGGTLKEWADDDDAFSALCATVSTGLRVKLRSWFKQAYPDSKNSLLRIENSPQFSRSSAFRTKTSQALCYDTAH